MLSKLKNKLRNTPSLRISFRYCLIFMIFILIAYIIIPILLNYGPGSINTKFDIEMSYISYRTQFIIISSSILIILCTIIHFLLKDIDEWYVQRNNPKYKDSNFINKIRKKCFNLPYLLFVFELIIPILLTTLFLLLTGSHDTIMITKILIFIFSFLLLLDVYSFVFVEDIYAEILKETYTKNTHIGFRVNITIKFFMQILPICITCLLVTSLIGYSRVVKEKEDIYFSVYNNELLNTFENFSGNYDEICSKLNSIYLYETDHSRFIITPSGKITTLDGPEANNFILEYTSKISEDNNGRTYDSYGVDRQGATLKISTSSR
ncbi:MAG: hypothetical protein Q4G05_04515 [Clostridia bacterium]|nr:hypothetical protein [Clostridia bacterium]